MKTTKAAQTWIDVVSRFYDSSVTDLVITEAKKIATERRAESLGRLHLEIAWERFVTT